MTERIENVVCTFCGCLCDDIVVEVDGGRLVKVLKACANGQGHFRDYDPSPRLPRLRGKEVPWEEAYAEAGAILRASHSPLIYGLSSAPTEAQRRAVELADRLGAFLDSTSSVCHGPTGLAMQAVGEPTCTLGEVRNRADLLLFWGCNPAAAHPRHFARYATARGRLTPQGRKDRTIVIVDVRPTAATKGADLFLQVRQGDDFELLTALRALVQGRPMEAPSVGGLPRERLVDLAERLKTCRYGVAFMGMGLTMTRGRDLNVAELFSLVADLNEHTRFSVIPMRGHGNVTGADQVTTWQCGFPFAVSFARGYPQYGPGEFTAVDVLARGDADSVVVVASDPVAHFPRRAADRLQALPTIVLDPAESLTAASATLWMPTGLAGIDTAGSSYRMDGVALRLRPFLERRRPSDEEVLKRLIEEVRR
ncbi:formylmethanofuran dehydrogenase subunit B [Aminithiophilus ramosus]|uniref:Formylmethanofuran dehydrogenase subunit B n=2 Tax=Synergistales TaxID=649776 RepID=A0A9Q7A624_9BACT|nr:formylmethanofuran dehydrogenase subunit B [Aminithiophilus ramosus]QTX31710.1 formylmethanofuran dehydrogenase subunit B [Aminithiophilus ramosus]QVL35533.1 formylmethanofuran dehydrogenase subunit B [Synergistota bacterium]